MKTILKATLIMWAISPAIANAGTVRSGGEEPMTEPEWICTSTQLEDGIQFLVSWRQPTVRYLGTANLDFLFEGGVREVFRASTKVGDDLGMTDSIVHFYHGELALALSN